MKTVEQFAELHALGLFLSEWAGDYATIIEQLNNEIFSEDLTVWQPFEDCLGFELVELIEDTKNDYLVFYSQVKGL
jgi:hypothetical protein